MNEQMSTSCCCNSNRSINTEGSTGTIASMNTITTTTATTTTATPTESSSNFIIVNGNNSLGQCSVPNDDTDKHCYSLEEAELPFRLDNVTKICCGKYHTVFITDEKLVYACGSNKNDQIGISGGTEESNQCTMIDKLKDKGIVDAFSYSLFTLFLSDSGKVYGVGQNDTFQIGLAHTKKVTQPEMIEALSNHKIITCAVGESHSLFLTDDHVVLGCGSNEFGQLGFDPSQQENVITPVKLLGQELQGQIKSIFAGAHHSVFITMDNSVLVCGSNIHGQCGIGGSKKLIYSPMFVYQEEPSSKQLLKAQKASCGRRHTILLDLQNRVWAFGHNLLGQLALPNEETRGIRVPVEVTDKVIARHPNDKIIDVAAGFNYTYFVTEQNRVLACGSNASSKLDSCASKKMITSPETICRECFHRADQEEIKVACGFFHSVIYKVKSKNM